MASFLDLPLEIVLIICDKLQPRHINGLIQTCTHFHRLLDATLWVPVVGDPTQADELFITASENGYLETLRKLVERYEYAGCCDRAKGRHVLMEAADKGHDAIVSYLLSQGVRDHFVKKDDPEWKKIRSGSALQVTAAQGHLQVIRALLDHNPSLDDKAEALWVATRENQPLAVLEILSKLDMDPVTAGDVYGRHPFFRTVIQENSPQILAALLDHGADPNGKDWAQNPIQLGMPSMLMMAAGNDCGWAVEMLLARGADVNVTDETGSTALHWVGTGRGKGGDERRKVVDLLLEKGGSEIVLMANQRGDTPVGLALRWGQLDIIQALRNHGATLTLAQNNGLLRIAAKHSDYNLVTELLDQKVDVNDIDVSSSDPDVRDWAALDFAAARGDLEMMKLLVSRGAIVNHHADRRRRTALHVALQKGRAAAAQWLLENGGDIDSRAVSVMQVSKGSLDGKPAYMYAVEGGVETFRLALDHASIPEMTRDRLGHMLDAARAGLGATDEELYRLIFSLPHTTTGETFNPLEYLCAIQKRMNAGMVRGFVRHCSDSELITRADESGWTLLHYSVNCWNENVVSSLLELGADVNREDHHGQTPLYHAAELLNLDAVLTLLAHGAIATTSESSEDPLIAALMHGDVYEIWESIARRDKAERLEGIVRALIAHGADINRLYPSGWSLLTEIEHPDDSYYQDRVVPFLLKLGVDPNLRNAEGKTALHRAAETGLNLVAAALVDGGADIALKTEDGKTALEIADEHEHHTIVDIILKASRRV